MVLNQSLRQPVILLAITELILGCIRMARQLNGTAPLIGLLVALAA